MNTIREGSVVRHTTRFLRATGWYLDVPIDGIVTSIDIGRPGSTRPAVVYVQWHDRDEAVGVLACNIELHPSGRVAEVQP